MLDLSTIQVTDMGLARKDGWSADKVAELRKLIEVNRLSAAEAAIKMGLSRNAVMGKCKRAGITMTKKGHGGRFGPKGGPSQAKLRVRTGRTGAVKPAAAPPQKLTAAAPYMPACDPMAPGTVRLVDLTGCKYASGSDGETHLFCDRPPAPDSVYCRSHHFICHRAPEPRARGFYR